MDTVLSFRNCDGEDGIEHLKDSIVFLLASELTDPLLECIGGYDQGHRLIRLSLSAIGRHRRFGNLFLGCGSPLLNGVGDLALSLFCAQHPHDSDPIVGRLGRIDLLLNQLFDASRFPCGAIFLQNLVLRAHAVAKDTGQRLVARTYHDVGLADAVESKVGAIEGIEGIEILIFLLGGHLVIALLHEVKVRIVKRRFRWRAVTAVSSHLRFGVVPCGE